MARSPFNVRLTGQWDAYLKALNPNAFERRLRSEVRRATMRNALIVQREIRARITQGAYKPNSALTLMLKAPKTKPLVDTGNLFGAVTTLLIDDYSAFVGVKFSARDKDGKPLVNLALALHEGFTVQVTPAMRAAVFAKLAEKQGGAVLDAMEGGEAKSVWVVPGRPFVKDVIEDPLVQRQLQANWTKATKAAIFGR